MELTTETQEGQVDSMPEDGKPGICPDCGKSAHYWYDDEAGREFGPRFFTCDDYAGCGYDEVLF